MYIFSPEKLNEIGRCSARGDTCKKKAAIAVLLKWTGIAMRDAPQRLRSPPAALCYRWL